MDSKQGKIAGELVGAMDERDRQIRNANFGYTLRPPEERILLARNVFRGFDESAQPGGNKTTFFPIEDRPGMAIEARIEFPMVPNPDENDRSYPFKWTNEFVISARASDVSIAHEQPDFVQLGVVEFNTSDPAVLHTEKGDIKFGEPGSEEILEIIDSAVLDVFYRDEKARKIIGHDGLALYWEKICSEKPQKTGVFSRIKDHLIGNRPE
jgi:hypothetical protein